MLQSQDNAVFYNVGFRKMDAQQAQKELQAIENDAVKQNALMKNIDFNGITATEIAINIPNGDFVNNYRTLFLYKSEYLIGISVVSYKKQLSDLVFEDLKEHFKLKI